MTSSRRVTVAPKGMGLNDFVAQQEGYFAAEGLDVEFDWKTFRGTQSTGKASPISSGRRTGPMWKAATSSRFTGRSRGRSSMTSSTRCRAGDSINFSRIAASTR